MIVEEIHDPQLIYWPIDDCRRLVRFNDFEPEAQAIGFNDEIPSIRVITYFGVGHTLGPEFIVSMTAIQEMMAAFP